MNDLDHDARALLRASRDGDRPSEIERARVRRKLMAAIGGAGTAGSAGTAHASAHAARGAVKLGAGAGGKLVASLLIVTAAASGVALWSNARVHAPVAAPAPSIAPGPIVTAPVQPSAQSAQVAVEPPDAPHVAAESAHATRAHEHSHAGQSASRERTHANASHADAVPANDEPPLAADALAPQVASAPPATQAPMPGTQDALSRELALISQAQRAVRAGQSERALQLLQRHAAEFPAGALLQERFATQALALCALGRVAEGQRAIGELARISASSPLLGSARRSCAAAAAPR